MRTALEHADDPSVLEATLHIGKLEGTWARFFARREYTIEQGAADIRDAWTTLTKGIDVKPVVRGLRAEAGHPLETDPQTEVTAGHAASTLLAGIYAHDKHHHLADAVQAALRAGMAEGKARTLALKAEQAGYTSPRHTRRRGTTGTPPTSRSTLNSRTCRCCRSWRRTGYRSCSAAPPGQSASCSPASWKRHLPTASIGAKCAGIDRGKS